MVIPSFVSDDVHVNIRFPHRPHPLQFFVCIHYMTMRTGKFKVFCTEQCSHSAIEQVGQRDEMTILRSQVQWLIADNTFHRECYTLNYPETIVCIETEVHKRRQPRFFTLTKISIIKLYISTNAFIPFPRRISRCLRRASPSRTNPLPGLVQQQEHPRPIVLITLSHRRHRDRQRSMGN